MAHPEHQSHFSTEGGSSSAQHAEAVRQQSMEHSVVPQLGRAPPRIAALITGDDELLRTIIKHVPFTDRHESCPLVCKKVRRWGSGGVSGRWGLFRGRSRPARRRVT